MSQPRDPYQQPHDQRASYGVPQQQPPYGRPQPYAPQQPYGQQAAYPRQPEYRPQPDYRERQPAPVRRPSAPSIPTPRRIPGLGLILTLVGAVVQILSLTVLPFVKFDANQPLSMSVPDLWKAATEFGTHGFGAWYLVLFSYPLAALGILLALATVLDSVALKVIWGGLAVVGLGYLVLRYGLGPFVFESGGTRFTRQEITTAVIAAAALVVVIFVLKTALSMFRRVAGLILLGLAGLHVAAVLDLVKGPAELGFGAIGPAVGYVLVAVAAFIGPRKIPGV
jgi:hypothetical protein